MPQNHKTVTIPLTSDRLQEIERCLDDLGPVVKVVATNDPHADEWYATITDNGSLVLRVPERFGWTDQEIELGDMEDSTQADHAMLEFLGDAPYAIRDLLTEVKRFAEYRGIAISAVRHFSGCRECGDGPFCEAGKYYAEQLGVQHV